MRVLIFFASTGGGHKRAAAALKEYIENESPDNVVSAVDGLRLTGKVYNKFICGGYTTLAKKMPGFYGKIYRNSDKKSKLNNLCNSVNKSKGGHLLPTIEKFKPDVIISCHAFITTMLGDLKLHGKISVEIIALVTDFAAHYTYIAEGVDHYVVSSDKMVNDFKDKYKIAERRVHKFGIPVFSRFSEPADKNELSKKLGLKTDVKTVLFMAGSFGVSEVLDFYKDISAKTKNCQFVVITGNNERLYSSFLSEINENTILLKFIGNVEDYMHCANLIITKPGGLTVSESITCSLPMAIYSAFPGQEADNAEYLNSAGVALTLDNNPGQEINDLINDSERLKAMSDNCKRIYPGNASKLICELAHSITEQKL